MDDVDTTVMVVTYNRLELTKQTIDSLSRVNKKHNLVIIDNNSKDGTKEYFDNFPYYNSLAELKIVFNSENKGIAIGRNQALKLANELNTKWFCTLDNDVLVPTNFLDEAIEIMKLNPRYGAIGVNMEGRNYPLVTENGKTFQSKPAGNLGTAAMVLSLPAHKMVGYFNTKYNKYGLEDSDMGMRLRVAGFKLGYIQEMGVHLGEDSDDTGDYRKWKTEQHDSKLKEFNANCAAYVGRKKPIFIAYKDA